MPDKHPLGKGIWIKRLVQCEEGDLARLANKARAAGFAHVVVQIADGADDCNVGPESGRDLVADLAVQLRATGVELWGWHAAYGEKPLFKGPPETDYHVREAECALRRLERLTAAGLRGCVIHAQGDYERAAHRDRLAAEFMRAVRTATPDLPIALASWKNPRAHPRFPWREFRSQCDCDMPQVFWIGRHGEAARQLERSKDDFARLEPRLPYVPTGPAFFENNWRPTPEDLVIFLAKAMALGLPAANLWSWDELALAGGEPHNPHALDFSAHWHAIAEFSWPPGVTVPVEAADRSARPAAAPKPRVLAYGEASAASAEAGLAPVPPSISAAQPLFDLEAIRAAELEVDLPEWLQVLDETESTTEPATDIAFSVEWAPAAELMAPEWLDVEAEDDLPEWLQFLNEPAGPGTELLTEAVDAQPATLSFEAGPAPTVSQAEAEARPDERAVPAEFPRVEALPDWLAQPAAAIAAAVGGEPTAEARAPVEAESDALPDWLKQPAAQLAQALSGEPAAPTAPPGLESEPPAFAAADLPAPESSPPDYEVDAHDVLRDIESEAELPEWLRFLDEAAAEVPVGELEAPPMPEPGPSEPPAEEALPEWLEQPAADLARAIALEDMGPAEEALPSWLQQPAAQLARAVAERPPSAEGALAPNADTARLAQAGADVSTASGPPVAESDTVRRFFEALRAGDAAAAVALYGAHFAHVTGRRVAHDPEAVRAFYEAQGGRLLGPSLLLLSLRGGRSAVNARWTMETASGATLAGTDTFHLNREGQIIYHHTTIDTEGT